MAAGNSSGNAQIFKLKVNKEKNTPFFYQQVKTDDGSEKGKWVDGKSFDYIEGHLKSIYVNNYTHEGKERQSLKLNMVDNETGDKMIVDMYLDNLTRPMLNALAGAQEIDIVKFEARKWGKGDEKWPTLFVKVNGVKESPRWKYQLSEIPQIVKTTNAKGIVVDWDDSDTNAFFKNVIDIDIMPKLKSGETRDETFHTPITSQPQTSQDDVDNLPF